MRSFPSYQAFLGNLVACEARAISITPVLDSFVMTIESSGTMPAKELVSKASEEIWLRAEALGAMLAELV